MSNLIVNSQNKAYVVNGYALTLPSTSIPYIRGGAGGSYINTGINPDSTTRIIIWARNYNNGGGIIAGTRNGANVHNCYLAANIGAPDALTIGYGGGATALSSNVQKYFCDYHKYEINANSLYVDDTLVGSATAATLSCSYPLHLFGLNSAGTHANMNREVDICACKIYKGGVLVRDFTAVNSPSVGLYDAVSQTLFTNSGSGSFTYGTFENSVSYTRLEYVTCSNSQYIDTGIYGTKSLIVAVRFQVTDTKLNNPTIFGTMRSGTSGTYFLFQFGSSAYINRHASFYIDGATSNQLYNADSPRLTNKILTVTKDTTTARLIENNAIIGTAKTFTASTSFTTSPDTILLGTFRYNGSYYQANAINGRIYYAGFGSEKNFIPVQKNNVAGFYDTYNDVFYPSESETAFIAGPEI